MVTRWLRYPGGEQHTAITIQQSRLIFLVFSYRWGLLGVAIDEAHGGEVKKKGERGMGGKKGGEGGGRKKGKGRVEGG